VLGAVLSKTWKGSVNSDWANAANWTPIGVPGVNDPVIIPAGTTNLLIIKAGEMVTCKSITLASGATISVATGGQLKIGTPN
jgi:hypothetical protein